MKIENKDLNIKEFVEKWDATGAASIFHKDECIYRDCFGFANKETKEPITEDSTYMFSGEAETLMALSILLLEDMKKLKLTDTIDKFIPEYIHASKITIKNMMLGLSGMRDYYYGYIMPRLAEDTKHNELDEHTRFIKETTMSTDNHSFNDVLKLIANDDLEFEPGNNDIEGEFNSSDKVFCREIIERASGMKLIDFEMKYIFEPLNMSDTKVGRNSNTTSYYMFRDKELIHVPVSETAQNLFVTSFADIEKLLLAMYRGEILSAKTWKKAFKFNENGVGIGFTLVNGTICAKQFGLLGVNVSLYLNKVFDLCYMHVSNSDLTVKNIEGKWLHFRKELRDSLDALYTYPTNTRIVQFGKSNWHDTLSMEITEAQREFVADTKTSIAFAFAFKKDHKLFVEMEGNRPVGLMVLQANKKADEFYFAIVLVDKHYQGRGYGKIMLKWGVEYFKKQGAKKLTIGVNRFNVAAINLYKSVGFVEDLVYEEGMELKLEL